MKSDKPNIWHIILGIFLLFLFILLTIRATDEYQWSDWAFGDAQTMLTLKHWKEGGLLANKLLFIPQGYAKVVKLFDEPRLRHHAHGTTGKVGPRLYYTHYPSGYLIPYALLSMTGMDNIFYLRMLSLFFSFGAIILMYILFSKITSPRVSLLAVLFYSLSPSFLGIANSIANQPLDDLFRFGFMLTIVFSSRASSSKTKRTLLICAWLAQFFLSLSSFDSVLFVYIWLIGWDIIERRGFKWKKYLIFAFAPLLAHSLQFLQNIWYLGLNDALNDISYTFFLKSKLLKGYDRYKMIGYSMSRLFDNLYKPAILIALMAIFYPLCKKILNHKNDKELPSVKLLFLLFLCGFVFLIVFPKSGEAVYQTRQLMPCAALLVSSVTWSFFKGLRHSFKENYNRQDKAISLRKKTFMFSYLLICSVILCFFWYRFIFNDWKPYYISRYHPDIILDNYIKNIPTKYDGVIFDMGGFMEFWDLKYSSARYPQIDPVNEYFVGKKPILAFVSTEELASDLIYMIHHSPYRFSPILISNNPSYIGNVIFILNKEGVLKGEQPKGYTFMDRYILDLTDYLKYEDAEETGGNRKN
jgi:hypothetical protein